MLRLVVKGGPDSGWYGPPKGTHTGEKHRAVGSGKAPGEEPMPKAGASFSTISNVSAAVLEKLEEEIDDWAGDRYKIALKAIRSAEEYEAMRLLSLRDGGELKGVAAVFSHTESVLFSREPVTEIEFLATKERGYGRAMMMRIARDAAEADQAVHLVSAIPATGFYKAIGMRLENGTRGDFYWTKEDVKAIG